VESVNSKIGLGTVQFGLKYGISNSHGQTSPEEVSNILNYCKMKGIRIIDTASAYGSSEEVLGSNELKDFKIVSKFMPENSVESLMEQLNQSLKKLGLKSLYGYLAHRPLSIIENPNQWEKLKELKKKKTIDKIGFSLNTPSELDVLIKFGISPDIIQVPFNYFDRRFENQMQLLKKQGCEIHVRSVFLQGLFFKEPLLLSDFFNPIKSTLISLQENYKENLKGSLLKFVLKQKFVDYVIIGVETTSQLSGNMNGILNAPELEDISFDFHEKILTPSMWPKEI